MNDRSTPRRSAGPPRGVLRTRAPEGGTEHRRVLPSAAFAPHVAHFWWVRWDVAQPFSVETLPHPSVHIVFETSEGTSRAEVTGVWTARFVKELRGRGQVFGIKFRPAAFQPIVGSSIAELANRVVPVSDALGGDGDDLARAIFRARDLDAKIVVAEAFLERRIPKLTPETARLRDLVERMASDRTLLRVEDAARALGVSPRVLQLRFRDHVGASPKWVIQRYRLHEAAEQLKGPKPPSLASLAASLGYADQAHFARDFRAMVGRTPKQFAEMERAR